MTGEHAQIVSNCGKSILTESSSGLAWPGGPTHPDLLLLLRPEREYTGTGLGFFAVALFGYTPHPSSSGLHRQVLPATQRKERLSEILGKCDI
jgi:hypothetical protein